MTQDIIITGASRGIGRALALALAERPLDTPSRLVLTARSEDALHALADTLGSQGTQTLCIPADLSTLAGAQNLGERLIEACTPGATLVHNAGLWPSRRELTEDGLERAYAVNVAAPGVLQRALLDARLLSRVMVISAGLLIKGRYAAGRTPTGDDFSSWRTYCNTKLAFAVLERAVAAAHPEIDMLVLHPGVVRTDLGTRRGLIGALLRLAKRSWESPETCGARLRRFFDLERWSPPGEPCWFVEDDPQPWPEVTEDPVIQRAVLGDLEKHASGFHLP